MVDTTHQAADKGTMKHLPENWYFFDGKSRQYPGPGNDVDPAFFYIEPGSTHSWKESRKGYDFFDEWIARAAEFPQGESPYRFSCDHISPYQQSFKLVLREYHGGLGRTETVHRYYCSAACAANAVPPPRQEEARRQAGRDKDQISSSYSDRDYSHNRDDDDDAATRRAERDDRYSRIQNIAERAAPYDRGGDYGRRDDRAERIGRRGR